MGQVEMRLMSLGLFLPEAIRPPSGVVLPFAFVQVRGCRILFSGHGPLNADGTIAQPLGKLGENLSVEEGYRAARMTALAVLSSLKRELGDLDRIKSWTRVFGMVNSAAGFIQQPAVVNGFSDLIIDLYGAAAGTHTRSAVGMAELPFNIPVEVEGEASLDA